MGTLGALFGVAYQSLRYRIGGVMLAIAAVAISVFVLLSVEHVRHEARSSFASTVSNVDLIVGARTGEINLLLLSIFRIGTPTANVAWESVEAIAEQPNVEWVVPISLGDSHKNFRVVGTTAEFFDRYMYGQSQPLTFQVGQRFDDTLDVVVGSRVAAELGYALGDELILSHGMADTSFTHHDQVSFSITGLLAPTGTPVDNALFVSLEAIEAIHADEGETESSTDGSPGYVKAHEEDEEHEEHEEHGQHDETNHHDEHAHHGEHNEHEDEHAHHDEHEEHEHKGEHADHDEHEEHEEHAHHEEREHEDEHGHHDERNEHEDEQAHHDEHVKHERHDEHGQETEHAHHDEHEEHSDHHGHDHPPLGTVTAILVGLDSPGVTLQVQRRINEYTDEALLAILPGFTLAQLWSLVGGVENVLRGISVLVFISALFGLNAMMLASMRERKREIEILRSIGAPSLFIVALLVIESLLVVTLGIVLALAGLIGAILVANNLLASELGIMLSLQVLYSSSFIALALIYLTTLILSLVPAWRAYAVAHSYSSGVEIN
ncbi:MAG: ABC transporter permease [Pseudomonadota bacterium]|nr:ABC transporter permease [Pseudomonadota bacterium]